MANDNARDRQQKAALHEAAHVVWHEHAVARTEREQQAGHRGCVVWFTGLSGCGKSSVANHLDQLLFHRGLRSFVLDGDNIRHGLSAGPQLLEREYGSEFAARFGLGFSDQDREENIRRIGSVAQLFASAGLITITAFVSPFRKDRDAVRRLVESERAGDFFEVFVNTPIEVCERRDPKGLYKKARAGEIKNFTGIDSPYEPPRNPELELRGGEGSIEELACQVLDCLCRSGVISTPIEDDDVKER